jgi:hypothetical protein
MYSLSPYVLRQEFSAPQDCHHFSLKHCKEAAHKIIFPRLSLGPLTPAPKWLLIPDPSMYQISALGLGILPGIHHSSLVSINTYIVLPTDFF